ncbi:MAG TPA: cytochrome P450 [Chitinophagaceae bacterium]|nr:cytochrome P450 [Chitinophagaceae bacterium]
MIISINEFNPIRFTKNFSYAKLTPTFINNHIGVSDEIARWVLDQNAILYYDERHAPHLCKKIIKKWIGTHEENYTPVIIMTDVCLYTSDSIVQYFEERALPQNKFIPEDEHHRKEVLDLYHLFTGNFFEEKVTRYVYERLLPEKKMALKLITRDIPFKEKLKFKFFYSMVKSKLTKEFNLDGNTANDHIIQIHKIFDQVSEILKDGRKYLTGDQFTLADLAFAAIGAMLILPEEYGGSLPKISQIPEEYRNDVHTLRASIAGQFILRIYQDKRPSPIPQFEIPKENGFVKNIIHNILIGLMKKQGSLFYYLQKKWPLIKIPFVKIALVCRNDLLVELMQRDEDFTVEEINSRKMAKQKGTFFLGMDKVNPQFDRERNMVRSAVKKEDLELIQNFVRTSADEIIKNALPYGKLDIADKLNKVIFVRLIDHYFGVSAPSDRVMRTWLRNLFYDLFLNLKNDQKKYQLAWQAANERRNHLLQLIKDRKQDLKDGKTLADNMLNRFILLQLQPGNEWFDDENIQRQIGGLITGILETSNKAVILTLDELLNRPEILKKAIATAHTYDTKKMYGYVQEALRFNPVQPGVIRFNEKEETLTGKDQKKYTIKAKRKIVALTAGAMFDPKAFENPKEFNPERNSVYMNYGYALHECYGKYINSVTLSELVAAVLRLKGVRREPNRAGHGSGLNQLSFPNNFVVRFDE